MENLTRLNTQVDALISALRGALDDAAQLRKELQESRAAGLEKDARINALETSGAEQDQRIRAYEAAISTKDAQLEELIARIEQVLLSLPQPVELIESVPPETNF